MRMAGLLTLTLLTVVSVHAAADLPVSGDIAQVKESFAGTTTLAFDLDRIAPEMVTVSGETRSVVAIPGEGTTYDRGMPMLPMVSRFVVVPVEGDIELVVRSEIPQRIAADAPPALCDDEVLTLAEHPRTGIYPERFVEMSDPVIIRGVRLVKVTVFPVQYDFDRQEYILHGPIETDVRSPIGLTPSPETQPIVIREGSDFAKYIRELAINGGVVIRRDDAGDPPQKAGHYLVVAHESALLWHLPFIEWRRKAGYRMDIRLVTTQMAGSPERIRDSIRVDFNRALPDPFDQVLIIGDRTTYDNRTAGPQHVITPFTGASIWGAGGPHADYDFGLMDNDRYADVSVSRFPSGSQQIANLVVGRTLAYEANPVVNNPAWLRRGMVYSQHWGNSATSAWHITIHTNVRWGEELLKRLNFNDITFYELYDWDQMGQQIGPVMRDKLNQGLNLLIGRAENYFWRDNFNGVNNNTVFPIKINLSGHGEWSAYNMFRTGDGNNLKGPVAQTFGWGGPPTAPNSYAWMEMVNATVLKDMTLGWGRMLAVTKVERYFQNINYLGRQLYDHQKTDIDIFGDPGIRPWLGVPMQVNVTHTTTINPDTRQVVVTVRNAQGGAAVEGAQVTLYAPGSLPQNNPADYANYRNMVMKTMPSDAEGVVRFIFGEGHRFTVNTPVYLTVTGRNIKPAFDQINVTIPAVTIDLAGYAIENVEGNGDEFPNPGETLDLLITARNNGNRDAVNDLIATVATTSPYVEIEAGDPLTFGNLAAGRTAEANRPIRLAIDPDCPDATSRRPTVPKLIVNFRSGQTTWESAIELAVRAPNFNLRQVVNGIEVGYNATQLTLELQNDGLQASSPMNAELFARGLGVTVINNRSAWPAVGAGQFRRQTGNAFSVIGNRLAVPGSLTPMLLVLRSDNGFVDSVLFNLQTSRPRANAPQGPDEYGYICFDDTDTDWDIAPRYSWIEISMREQNRNFNGTSLNFNGQVQYDIGESRVVRLPFQTQFYGRVYDTITVGSNGFIAMGNQPRITNFQNWPMDQAIGGGMGMIAPLWDDFRLDNNSAVYTYFDEQNHRFIVEWYKMKLSTLGNPVLTFQVILLDRRVWVTETGDPNIIFQYKEFTADRNIRDGDQEWVTNIPYASVGISSPDGRTGINYVYNNAYPVTSAQLAVRRALLFSTAPRFRAGTLYGRVLDAATGRPVQDVEVFTQHGFYTRTDANGRYRIADALAEVSFNLTARIAGYNDSTRVNLVLEENDSLETNFGMLHPEFELNVQRLETVLQAGTSREMPFTLRNRGNGPLSWSIDRRLLGDANAGPWDLRRSYRIGQLLDDDRIEGVVFTGEEFIVAGAANGLRGDRPNMVYVLDREGELIDTFRQAGASQYGYRDLAWDGETVWASGEATVFGFTPQGEVQARWNGPLNPNTAIAYDSDLNCLWIGSITQNYFAYDREGNRLGRTLNRRDLRTYGLTYFPDDPDGYDLYILSNPGPDTLTIHKMDTETGDTMGVARIIQQNMGAPAGASITNEFDVYSWVFLTIGNFSRVAGGDRIDVYQIDARRDWFLVEPTTGILNAGEVQDLTLALSAIGLPVVTFRAELYFTHNAAGGRFSLPVTLEVTPGAGVRDRRGFDLTTGWNAVSLNVEPDDPDLRALMRPLTDAGVLSLVKDGRGRFYRPGNDFNNIPGWVVSEGYELYLTEPARWEVEGEVLPVDQPVPLVEGWNLAGYMPRRSALPQVALAGIAEQLIIAKDASGRFYLPEFDFSNMEPLREGQAYRYKMTAAAELVYQVGGGRNAAQPPSMALQHFSGLPDRSGGPDMSLLLLGDDGWDGYEAALFGSGGNLVGAGRFDRSGRCGVAILGDDPETASIEGARPGESFTIRLWNGAVESDASITVVKGGAHWQADGLAVLRVAGASEALPVEFGIAGAFPNPFNGTAQLVWGLDQSGPVRMAIYDLAGREVARLAEGTYTAGLQRMAWTAGSLPAGLYFARLESVGRSSTRKLMLIK